MLFVISGKVEFIAVAYHTRSIANAVTDAKKLACFFHTKCGDVFFDPDSQMVAEKTVEIAALVTEGVCDLGNLQRLHIVVVDIAADLCDATLCILCGVALKQMVQKLEQKG